MPHQDDPSTFELPTWITRYGSTLREFGRDPSGFVIGIVATWIVGGILMMGRQVLAAILLAFDSILNALALVEGVLVGSLDSVGAPVLELAGRLPAFYAGLVEPFGPLAPVVAVGVGTLIIVATYRLLKALVLEIPILGGLLEFLGVDL